MGILRYPVQKGTSSNDVLMSGSQSLTMGLAGDDELRATASSEYNYLAGGLGNDKYYSAQGAAITIFDTGGVDTVFAPRLGITDLYTYAATVDNGKHLLAWSSRYGDQIAIANWRDPENAIEYVSLGDGVFTLSEVVAAVQRSPNYRGDFSIEQLSYVDVLPTGTTTSDIQEFLRYIVNLEASFTNSSLESTTPTYSVSTSSSSVNEGGVASYSLSTTNVNPGTAVAYTLSGVSPADIVGGAMSGSVTVGSNGHATISIPIAADNLTEGTETLTVTAQGKSASVTINDTSTGTAKSESSSIPQGNYTLNAIVDLFGQVLYLKVLFCIQN